MTACGVGRVRARRIGRRMVTLLYAARPQPILPLDHEPADPHQQALYGHPADPREFPPQSASRAPTARGRRTSQPRRVSAERWSHLADSLLDARAPAVSSAQAPTARGRRTSQPRRVSAERWSHLADSLLDAVARGLVPSLGLVGVNDNAGCANSAVAFLKRLAKALFSARHFSFRLVQRAIRVAASTASCRHSVGTPKTEGYRSRLRPRLPGTPRGGGGAAIGAARSLAHQAHGRPRRPCPRSGACRTALKRRRRGEAT